MKYTFLCSKRILTSVSSAVDSWQWLPSPVSLSSRRAPVLIFISRVRKKTHLLIIPQTLISFYLIYFTGNVPWEKGWVPGMQTGHWLVGQEGSRGSWESCFHLHVWLFVFAARCNALGLIIICFDSKSFLVPREAQKVITIWLDVNLTCADS